MSSKMMPPVGQHSAQALDVHTTSPLSEGSQPPPVSVASPLDRSAWTSCFPSQLVPPIPPTFIDTVLRHKSDPERRRATFGLQYPVYEIVLEKKADLVDKLPPRFENGRRTISSIRFYFKATDLFIPRSDFKQCKFHRFLEAGNSRMAGTTFIECTFENCIFGGTTYRHVRFEHCTFRRSDFAMSQFIDCQFRLCIFTECTAEHVSFSATEIDPTTILAGVPPPHYNYGSPYDGELSPAELTSQWLEVRRALAAQLLKSNGEIHHTRYCDAALVNLKNAELSVRVDQLKSRSIQNGVVQSIIEAVRCGASWLVLALTKGGTSVARLILIALVAIPLYATLLSVSFVTFHGKSCHLTSFGFGAAIGQLSCATSLFLALGYTAFVASSALELALLTLGAGLGLIWYALLAAVVIRRVYR
jgi:Pentapeptide repeats (9 copies)